MYTKKVTQEQLNSLEKTRRYIVWVSFENYDYREQQLIRGNELKRKKYFDDNYKLVSSIVHTIDSQLENNVPHFASTTYQKNNKDWYGHCIS